MTLPSTTVSAFVLSSLLLCACSGAEERDVEQIEVDPMPAHIQASKNTARDGGAMSKKVEDTNTGTFNVPDAMMSKVRADLSKRLGHDEFVVKTATATTWSDGSLGCPEPDGMYTQMLQEGYHVIFEAKGKRYDYRMASSGYFKLCTSPGTTGKSSGIATE